MTQTPSTLSSYIHLHFLVLLWGFTAILGKLISIPSLEIVFYRTFLALVFIFLIIKLRRGSLILKKTDLVKMISTGAIVAVHWILFFLSARVSNVSICLSGIATVSLWTSILEPIFLRRKIKYYESILGIVAVIGISVVFESVIDQYVGFIIAVLSALLASIFTIINGRLVKKTDHYVISFYQMLGACISIVLMMLIYTWVVPGTEIQLSLNYSDAICLLILSLVCTVYAYSSSIKLMHKLSAFTINLTVNLEPVYGIILAVLIFQSDEEMGTSFYWGTAIILCSVLLYPVLTHYDKKKVSPDISK